METVCFWVLLASALIARSASISGKNYFSDNELVKRPPHPVAQQRETDPSQTLKSPHVPSRRLFGRHVCAHKRVVNRPIQELQSYCKPTYQSYLRRCEGDAERVCTGYRVVYELAYRTVQKMVPQTETIFSCCPGWTQASPIAHDCIKETSRKSPNFRQGPEGYEDLKRKIMKLEQQLHGLSSLSNRVDDLSQSVAHLRQLAAEHPRRSAEGHDSTQDRINSLSEQISILEERLEEYTDEQKAIQDSKTTFLPEVTARGNSTSAKHQ